ncbi:MAG: phosphoglycerate dehydrogenase [Ignavibacteriaceae bacterium]
MKKILISDQVNEKSVAILESAGFSVTYKPGLKKEEIQKIIPDYNALIVRSATQVDAGLISLMYNMEVIGRAGTGVDNIDVSAASRKGILVMNTPGGNTISTAEHTMAMILSLCRNIPQANKSLIEGRWDRKKYSGTELRGKTLAVLGLGKIGKEVAKRAKAFGINVIGFDPLLSDEVAAEFGIQLLGLDEIWSKADIITVHVPLNDSTKDLISKSSLEKCKTGVKIINCARGGIVNELDIIEAADSGKVSGAAFDVYVQEPPDFSSKLFAHPKIICTPHLGASTEEAQELVAIQISDQIKEYFLEKKITGAVNIKGFAESLEKDVQSYVLLCETLGSFVAQLLKDQLKSVDINFSGKSLHKYSTELTTSLLKGFLSKKLSEPVNYVNAPLLINDMKIVVNERKSEESSIYKNLVTVEIQTDKVKRKISGTVFGTNEIRIVQIDDYSFELNPKGYMLLYLNIDKPGMLASVGKILADGNVNIAGLSLGRIEKGKEALTVINTDSEIPERLIKNIESINGINYIYKVNII